MKRMYVLASAILIVFVICSCGNNTQTSNAGSASPATAATTPADQTASDPGIGNYKNVQLTHPLDTKMAENGKNIYEVKCLACHKLTTEKVVGPGWKGVTDRRSPEYILNFVTNTDEMLEKDPNAKQLLSVCMVRMPNQHLSDIEARSVLEFMRQNDGKN